MSPGVCVCVCVCGYVSTVYYAYILCMRCKPIYAMIVTPMASGGTRYQRAFQGIQKHGLMSEEDLVCL